MDTSKKMGGALGAKRGSTKREEGVAKSARRALDEQNIRLLSEAIIAIGAKAAKRLLKRVVETQRDGGAGHGGRLAQAHARRRLLPSIARRDDAGGPQAAHESRLQKEEARARGAPEAAGEARARAATAAAATRSGAAAGAVGVL